MAKIEREARLQRAKVVGRIAYRLLRSCEIEGVLTYDGEEKHLQKCDDDGLDMELIEPFRPYALVTEFSRIQIRVGGRKVFEIRWDSANNFKVVLYEPGDWERELLNWPEPIPF
jgi:hypothetical protein